MITKKNLLEKVIDIRCLLAEYNARRRAEHEDTKQFLQGLVEGLGKIYSILTAAMQEDKSAQEKDLFQAMGISIDSTMEKLQGLTIKPESEAKEEIPIEGLWQGRWLAGADAAKAIGWRSVSAKALKQRGIGYEQPGGRGAGLLVDAKDLERYLKKKKKYNRK